VNGAPRGRPPFAAAGPLDLEPVGPATTTQPSPSPGGTRPPAGLPPRWYVVPLAVVLVAAVVHAVMVDAAGSPAHRARPGAGDERPPPGWERGAVGPLPSGVGHVQAWTGSELIIWGGATSDGAAYNPSKGVWRKMAPAPFPASAGAASAWTGWELLVWGGESGGPPAAPTGTGGAYDVATGGWRRLPPAPLSARRPLASAWTGDVLVIVGGTAGDGRPLVDGAAYDPDENRWTAIAALPVAFRQAAAVWTGQEVVVFGTTAADPTTATGVAWHPASDRWRVLPRSPLTGSRVTAVWTGRELVAWDDRLTAAAVEVVSGRWRTLPDIPSIPGFCDPAGVRAGDVVFAELCGRGAIYDPAEGRWRPTTHPYFLSGQPVWTGRRLLWWTGAFRGSRDSIWAFAPARPAGRADGGPARPPPPASPDSHGCAVSLSGRPEPPSVRPGEDFVWSLTVTNRSPCRFARLALSAFVSTTRQVRYWLVAEDPPATEHVLHSFSAEAVDSGVTWPEAGPLEPGSAREFAVRGRVAPDSARGRIDDDVEVVAVSDGPAANHDADGRIRLSATVVDAPPPRASTPGAGGHRGGGR